MIVKFWGVRGSIPTPGPSTMRYGGNTPAIEFWPKDEGGPLFIIDAGTGIRELGLSLLPRMKPIHANVFLSHTHWDHIHGFPFFVPAFIPGNKFVVHGPVNFNERLEDIVSGQMKYSYFPVKLEHMAADITFVELKECTFEIEGVKITTHYLNHPILVLGYRFEYEGKVFVTMYDNEQYQNVFNTESDNDMDDLLFGGFDEDKVKKIDEEARHEADSVVEEMNARAVEFGRGADLLIFDAQYTTAEYPSKVGWGHSTIDDAINVSGLCGCKRLALFHHEPTRNDDGMDAVEQYCAEQMLKLRRNDCVIFAAREGMEIRF